MARGRCGDCLYMPILYVEAAVVRGLGALDSYVLLLCLGNCRWHSNLRTVPSSPCRLQILAFHVRKYSRTATVQGSIPEVTFTSSNIVRLRYDLTKLIYDA